MGQPPDSASRPGGRSYLRVALAAFLASNKKIPDQYEYRSGIIPCLMINRPLDPRERQTGVQSAIYISPGRSSDFRISPPVTPSHPCEQWLK